MKRLKINDLPVRFVALALVGLAAAAVAPAHGQVVSVDNPWVGATGDWNTASNWTNGVVPNRANGQFPVIDNAGVATVSANAPDIGGLRIGTAAGNSGTLEITGGTLVSTSAGVAGGGNGIVNIGVGGTGTLRMTGGIFRTRDLNIGANAANLVQLEGAAKLEVFGNAGIGGTTRITGSGVQYTATNFNLRGSSVFAPVITSNNAFSTLKTTTPSGVATIQGSITVDLTAVAPPLGSTWSLFEAGAVVGNFTNAGNVTVTSGGLPLPLVQGEAYRTRVTTGGTFGINGRKLELVHDSLLVLEVNRDTGVATIKNPLNGAIQISGYSISSAVGALKSATWNSLTDQATPGFQEANAAANQLGEFNPTTGGNFNFSSVATKGIGAPYDDGAAFFSRGVGVASTDLVFEYLTLGNAAIPAGEIIRGQVIYTGVGKTNTLLLTVNAATGAATLKNDSPGTITVDGFSILSTGGALVPGSFNGLGSPQLTSVPSNNANALSQLAVNPTSPLAIPAGQTFNLGNIFAVGQPQTGFSLEFTTPGQNGDYNDDGRVDGNDFVVWQRTLGSAVTAGTGADGNNNGTVDAGDLAAWRSGVGAPPGNPTNVYNGVVRFEGGAASAVPEPTTSLLLVAAACSARALRRRRGGSGA